MFCLRGVELALASLAAEHGEFDTDLAQRVSSGPAQTISGIDARAIAAGDFNGDGFVDLAVATGSGTGVLLNIVDPANASRRILSSTPIAGST